LSFVKLHRSDETITMIRKDPKGFVLLSWIALRANRETGEAMLGDWEAMGYTSRGAYRNTLNRLLRTNKVTTRTTTKGTLAKLVNTGIFDINEIESSQQASHQSSPQAPKKRATNQATNKKYKKLYIQEVQERGVPVDQIESWLALRTAKRNTETALAAQLKNLDYLIENGYSPSKIFEVMNEKSWIGIRTGKNPKDQFFLDELKEHPSGRESITDTGWANGDQSSIRNTGVNLPRVSERLGRDTDGSGEKAMVKTPIVV